LNGGARRAHDAARANGAGMQVFQEQRFMLFAFSLRLDRGQRPRHAPVHVFEAAFARFQVFFLQHIMADGLGGGQVLRPAKMFTLHVWFFLKKALRDERRPAAMTQVQSERTCPSCSTYGG
jgi:hypothetical protein